MTISSAKTAGTSICLQENGAILVAGSSGSGKDQDIALFRFLPHGHYDPSFGSKGMVVRDINHDEDGAYDIVATPSGVFVGGYATMNGKRDFVLLRYSFTGVAVKQGSDTDKKPESSVHIGEPGREKTYVDSEVVKQIEAAKNPEVNVTTTSISSFDDTGYSLAVQQDNKIILVGSSGEEGLNTYALARYTYKDSVKAAQKSAGQTSAYIITTEVTEITRNSALTGGTIFSGSGLSFTSRGVVYSIAPYPILTSGGTDGGTSGSTGTGGTGTGGTGTGGTGTGGTGTGGWDDVGPVQSDWAPTGTVFCGTTTVKLSVNTNVPAECRYDDLKDGLTFDTMTKTMTSSGGASPVHTAQLTGLMDGGSNTAALNDNYVYAIRCKDTATGVANQKNHNVPFAVCVAAKILQVFTGTVESQSKAVKDPVATTTGTAAKAAIPGAKELVVDGKSEAGSGVGSFSVILTNLSIGTRYYVRAYGVTSTGLIYYGNQLSFETKDACFIATAAYGSLAHPDVKILRTFRDLYLKPFVLGRTFIDTYYHYSPALARVIEQHPLLRSVVRVLLQPVIGASYMLIHFSDYWIVYLSCLSGPFLIFGWRRLRVRKEAFS